MAPESIAPQTVSRVASIDALRGLTILLMIFVNDLAGVANVPWWLLHYHPWDADGMTFVDVIFPAFLFIVGMSIPFALGRRFDKGERVAPVLKHVLARTASLLVIGVFMVNGYVVGAETPISRNAWNFLMFLGVIMVWRATGREKSPKDKAILGAGLLLLAAMALIFRADGREGFFQLRGMWWGILGLIGWAYLVGALSFIWLRRNQVALVAVMAMLYILFVVDRTGFFDGWQPFRSWVDFGSMLGSHAGITVGGVILGNVLAPGSAYTTHCARMTFANWYAATMIVAGYALYQLAATDPMWIINKNLATVPWCLISAGWTVWAWVILYWLMDVRGWTRWAGFLRPAGENPLFAYILQPMVYAGIGVVSAVALGGFDPYATLGERFWTGLPRAMVFALVVTWSTGWLKDRGLRLKL